MTTAERLKQLMEGATRGPWVASWKCDNLSDIYTENGSVASVATWSHGVPGTPETTDANARLIVAASPP